MPGFGVLGGALGSFQAPLSRACSYLQPAAGTGSAASPGFLGILPRDPGWRSPRASPLEGQDKLRRCQRSLPRPKSRDLGSSGPALHSPILPWCRSPRHSRFSNLPWRISQFLGKLRASPAPHQAPAGLGVNLGVWGGLRGRRQRPQSRSRLRGLLPQLWGHRWKPQRDPNQQPDPCGSRRIPEDPGGSLCPRPGSSAHPGGNCGLCLEPG